MFVCLECGRKFKTANAAEKAAFEGCSGCGGVDIDIDIDRQSVPQNKETKVNEIKCLYCGSGSTSCQGEYAAPGYGKAYLCGACGKGFAVIGRTVLKEAPVFDPEDVE